MADADCSPCCAQCGERIEPRINKTTGLPSKAARRFCNRRCMASWHQGRRPKRVRLTKRQIRPVACCGCGITSARPMRADEAGRYCSRKCNTDAMARVAGERAALYRMQEAWAWRPSPLVIAEAQALRRIARREWKPRRLMSACRGCHAPMPWVRKAGGSQRICDACQSVRRKAGHDEWRQSESGKKAKRIAKSRRRAVMRGIGADKIDPLAVFDRDKWTCQLCGKRTPKGLRGQPVPDAPELDHIIPLALGGGHTWPNVQCTCRRCNAKKGATVKGQLGLPLAA